MLYERENIFIYSTFRIHVLLPEAVKIYWENIHILDFYFMIAAQNYNYLQVNRLFVESFILEKKCVFLIVKKKIAQKFSARIFVKYFFIMRKTHFF